MRFCFWTDSMYVCVCICVLSRLVVSDSLPPHGLWPARLLFPWHFPGKNTWVGCYFLLQGIFKPWDPTSISGVFCIGMQILHHYATWKALRFIDTLFLVNQFMHLALDLMEGPGRPLFSFSQEFSPFFCTVSVRSAIFLRFSSYLFCIVFHFPVINDLFFLRSVSGSGVCLRLWRSVWPPNK